MRYILLLTVILLPFAAVSTVEAIAIKNEGVKEKKIKPQGVEGIAAPTNPDCSGPDCVVSTETAGKADLKELAEQLVNTTDEAKDAERTLGTEEAVERDDIGHEDYEVTIEGRAGSRIEDTDENEEPRLKDDDREAEMEASSESSEPVERTEKGRAQGKGDAKKALDAFIGVLTVASGTDDGANDDEEELQLTPQDVARYVSPAEQIPDELKNTWVKPSRHVIFTVDSDMGIEVGEVKVDEDQTVHLKGVWEAKLFKLFTLRPSVEVSVSSDGEVVEVEKPWYAFLLW